LPGSTIASSIIGAEPQRKTAQVQAHLPLDRGKVRAEARLQTRT